MKHNELVNESMKLLEEAMSQVFKKPSRGNTTPEPVKEEMSDSEIDAAMNKNAPKDPVQVKLRKALDKKKKETPAQKKAREAAETVAQADSDSDDASV
tara:strand:- start:424 stop:717 length:294 start_codon:yes stop_codon:yes gene_type:complete